MSHNVGVVIATRDRRDNVLGTLRRLRSLPERPPLVLVDNGSRDATPEAVEETFPDVTVVRQGVNTGAAARTAGVRAVDTELVAFSDDDSWWAPGALERAGRLFARHPRLGLIAARILVGPEQRLDPTCEEMRRSPVRPRWPLPGPAVLGFVACGAIVRRDAFLEVGGFHPRFVLGAEERLVALDLAAAGWDLVYHDDVVAHHHPWDGGSPRPGRLDAQRRNEIWTAWLRRPVGPAVRTTLAAARAGGPGAVVSALRGLPWVLRQRRVLPAEVERAVRAVERANGGPLA